MIGDSDLQSVHAALKPTHGGVREDYFGLLYLEQQHGLPRHQALDQTTRGNRDYGIDGFHYDAAARTLYMYQFKYSKDHKNFRVSLEKLIADGLDVIFGTPGRDNQKNDLLVRLHACLQEYRYAISQLYFRFVFLGDPQDADKSSVLEKLREDLENRRDVIDRFFRRDPESPIQLIVDFRSASGALPVVSPASMPMSFEIPAERAFEIRGANGEEMHILTVPLLRLGSIYASLGGRFFESNIRFGLSQDEYVNRSLDKAFRDIASGKASPEAFVFNHTGVTLHARSVERSGGKLVVHTPQLLNGAQTVTTFERFRQRELTGTAVSQALERIERLHILVRLISKTSDSFKKTVTICNNRQNPVDAWQLHSNDDIQRELQDWFKDEIGIYYERQENAFGQLTQDDLDELSIKSNKEIKLIRLARTYLATDGMMSRLTQFGRVFEDERHYEELFRKSRLRADARQVVLCYLIQFRLRYIADHIKERGQKYGFAPRAHLLIWALMAQAILNDHRIEDWSQEYGGDLSIRANFSEILADLASRRVRLVLSDLIEQDEYAEDFRAERFGFLRTNRAFEQAMAIGGKRFGWEHRKLDRRWS